MVGSCNDARRASTTGMGIIQARLQEIEALIKRLAAGKSATFQQYCQARLASLPKAMPLVRKGIPALERDRLLYVQQNYIRPDTLSRANARLVDYQAQIPLAKSWGGGEVASADGLRFVDVSSDHFKVISRRFSRRNPLLLLTETYCLAN